MDAENSIDSALTMTQIKRKRGFVDGRYHYPANLVG